MIWSVTIFDSGFQAARLLKYDWFRDKLKRAGWVSGDHMVAVSGEVTFAEVARVLRFTDSNKIWVVQAEWHSIEVAQEMGMPFETNMKIFLHVKPKCEHSPLV